MVCYQIAHNIFTPKNLVFFSVQNEVFVLEAHRRINTDSLPVQVLVVYVDLVFVLGDVLPDSVQ